MKPFHSYDTVVSAIISLVYWLKASVERCGWLAYGHWIDGPTRSLRAGHVQTNQIRLYWLVIWLTAWNEFQAERRESLLCLVTISCIPKFISQEEHPDILRKLNNFCKVQTKTFQTWHELQTKIHLFSSIARKYYLFHTEWRPILCSKTRHSHVAAIATCSKRSYK